MIGYSSAYPVESPKASLGWTDSKSPASELLPGLQLGGTGLGYWYSRSDIVDRQQLVLLLPLLS